MEKPKLVRSLSLVERENDLAANATSTFNERQSESGEPDSQEENVFTFADRSHWPHFQKLLQSTGDTSVEESSELESQTDLAMSTYEEVVTSLLATMKERAQKPNAEAFVEETFVSTNLKDCIFVGHLATDLDSIAGAMGAAKLFNGIASKSEAVLNGEIMYVLEKVCELEEPQLYDDIPGASTPIELEGGKLGWKNICLVDHNEEKQMVESLQKDPNRRKRIVGLIDHHTMAESFSTDVPMMVEVRPWGSMSTIVAHMYLRNNARMEPAIARLLMCAILSDTLNLNGPTTTDADRFAVALLAMQGSIANPDEVARLMFGAKTTWIMNLGAYAMVRGDHKVFKDDNWKFGISVLEVTDMEPVLKEAANLLVELRLLKVESGKGVRANQLDFAFLFIIDIIKQCSVLLVCGGREYALASKAFEGCPFKNAAPGLPAPGQTISDNQTLCDVGPLVSRKKQFYPAFANVLKAGFTCHKERVSSDAYVPDWIDLALEKSLAEGGTQVELDQRQEFQRKGSQVVHKAVFGEELPAEINANGGASA
jgi:inorganic pyrophosphatase/exopolyphosphatase